MDEVLYFHNHSQTLSFFRQNQISTFLEGPVRSYEQVYNIQIGHFQYY